MLISPGLGKTLQSLTFLSYLVHERQLPGPHLIIVPFAVCQNWRNEIKRWTKDISFCTIRGMRAERIETINEDRCYFADYNFVLTTFETIVSDQGLPSCALLSDSAARVALSHTRSNASTLSPSLICGRAHYVSIRLVSP